MSHVGLMMLYAAGLSIFFGTLLRHDVRAAARFAAKMFLILTGASLLAAWAMYFFAP